MHRSALVLVSAALLLGTGAATASRAEADCHTVDPACKALRKQTSYYSRLMMIAIRDVMADLKKEGKDLAREVKKGTLSPEDAFDCWMLATRDTVDTCVETVDVGHDYTLAAYNAATAAASGNLKLKGEIDPGCGGAADLLREKTRDCMELVRDGLGCTGAFKPLKAALECEHFDINWQALELRDPLPLLQMKNFGGASTPVFLKGAPVVAAATCEGTFSLVVLAGQSSRVVQVYANTEDANMELGEPLAEYVLTADDGLTEIVEFEGLPASDEPYYYRITSVANQESSAQAFNRDVESFHVPAWSEAPAACTVTGVTATWNSSPVAVGPLSAINVIKNADGDITFVLAMFAISGEAGSLSASWTFGTPVDPAITVYSKQPGDTLNVGGTVYNNSFTVDTATITNIGNLLITSPGSAAGIHITGAGFHPSEGPAVIDICVAGIDANVTTGP